MSSPSWFFPVNSTGGIVGCSSGAVETYDNASINDGIAREICQNSLDAHRKGTGPVAVEFRVEHIVPSKYPEIEALKERIEACKKFWDENGGPDARLKSLLDSSIKMLKSSKVKVLVASDYNTTGLIGSHEGMIKKNPWNSLVTAEGVSDKEAGSGGSYGIGKNAPFAASASRTVFYNTKAADGQSAFMGVARLASMWSPEKKPTVAVGRLGIREGDGIRPVNPSDACGLRDFFKREKYGTDVIILGFRGSDTWEKDIICAILKNFFVAIAEKRLVVKVGEIVIKPSTLAALEEKYSQEPGMKDFYDYYQAFSNPDEGKQIKKRILEDDDVEIYLKTGEGMSKRSCNINSHGMFIGSKTRRTTVPFSSVLVVRGKKLGELLSSAEDPEHKQWDYTRAKPRDKEAKKVIQSIDTWTKDCVKGLVEIHSGEEIDAEIGDYLAGGGIDEGPQAVGDDDLKLTQTIQTRLSIAKQNTSTRSGHRGTGSKVDGDPHNSTRQKRKRLHPEPSGVVQGDGTNVGAKVGPGTKTISTLSVRDMRIVPINVKAGLYHLVVLSDTDTERASIKLKAGSDSGQKYAVGIKRCMLSGKAVGTQDNGAGPFSLHEGKNDLFITVDSTELLQLDIDVTEA